MKFGKWVLKETDFIGLREVEDFENYGPEILDVWYEIWERECEVRDMELKDGMWEIRWGIWVRNIVCGGMRCEIKYMEWGMKMWAVDWICDSWYWMLDMETEYAIVWNRIWIINLIGKIVYIAQINIDHKYFSKVLGISLIEEILFLLCLYIIKCTIPYITSK